MCRLRSRIVLIETKTRLKKIFSKGQIKPMLATINNETGKLWIKSTNLAHKNKMFRQAPIYVLNVEAYEPKELFLERLESPNRRQSDLVAWSRGRVVARYNAEAIMLDSETNRKLFTSAIVNEAENEKVFLLTAEYMDPFYSEEKPNEIARVGHLKMVKVLIAYQRSMQLGRTERRSATDPR